MTNRSHITQRNGSSRMVLTDDIRPFPEQIRFSLERMNGTTFWAWSLWRAPEGANLLASLPFSDEYMQCAGSAQALTIEVRIVGSDGTARQYTVGKPNGTTDGALTKSISWDDGRHSTKVYPHEVFTAEEAADVFYAYYLSNAVDDPYVLREHGQS